MNSSHAMYLYTSTCTCRYQITCSSLMNILDIPSPPPPLWHDNCSKHFSYSKAASVSGHDQENKQKTNKQTSTTCINLVSQAASTSCCAHKHIQLSPRSQFHHLVLEHWNGRRQPHFSLTTKMELTLYLQLLD